MSGGSYNYLCWAVSTGNVAGRRDDIEAMEKRLQSSGYYAAARATREVLNMLEAANRIAASLEGVWHAVEWKDSNDYTEDQVIEEIQKFAPWPPPLATAERATS